MHRNYLVGLILLAVTAAVFYKVTDNGFFGLDDDLHVYTNPTVLNPTVSGVLDFWKAPYERLYIPLTYTVWSLQSGLIGSRLSSDDPSGLHPGVFHTGNLLLHLCNVLLVFVILRRLAGDDWAAGAGALLFAIHPVQVEAVAWISEMKGLLSGTFALLAIWRYTVYAAAANVNAAKRRGQYLIATLCFVLAMLSKPSAVAIPVAAGAIAYGLLRRPALATVREVGFWVVLTLPVIAMTKLAQPDAPHDFLPVLWQRLLVAGDAISFYLYKLLVPVGLGIDYGRSPEFVLQQPWIYLTGLAPYLLGALLIWKAGRPWVLVPAIVFVVALLPVLGLVTFDFQHISTVADRYMYLAMLGPALGVARFLLWRRGWVPRLLCMLALAGCTAAGAGQVQYWETDKAVFEQALRVNDRSWLANNSLGLALRKSGRAWDAIPYYQAALRLRPDYPKAHINLGIAYLAMGNSYKALEHLRAGVELEPEDAVAHNNYGAALSAANKNEEAVRHFREAIRLRPDYVGAHTNLGGVLYLQGDVEGAVAEFRKALEIDPGASQARQALRRLGVSEAVEDR